MSSTVTRKTGSATLVINNFSQRTFEDNDVLDINGLYIIYFGVYPKTDVHNVEYVSIYFISWGNFANTFKYKLNVSILNSKGEKLFTREYGGEFTQKIDQNYFNLMPRSEVLLPANGYLYNDKLTLLCEIEVIDDDAKDTISKDFNNLSENLQSLLSDGKFADATLVIGLDGKEFPVHKAILAARSPVFAAMFEHDCEEKRQNKANITDMDEEVGAEMLSYIYTGKVKELDRFAMELLVAADKYQLPSLSSICSEYMCNHLSVESVSNVLILADLHQATELKTKCFEYISANVKQVESTEGWKQLDTKAKLLKELFVYLAKKK